MSLSKVYSYYYWGKQNFLKEDFNSAFWFGRDCWEETATLFDQSSLTQKRFCLDLLFKSSKLMCQSLIESNKIAEAAEYINANLTTFNGISKSKNYQEEIRNSASFLEKRLRKEHIKILN